MAQFDSAHFQQICNELGTLHPTLNSPGEIWKEVIAGAGDLLLTWGHAIVHGDPHGDNIFFDMQSKDVWVIDFARTGKRLDIFDFVFLEADLKFRQLFALMGETRRATGRKFLRSFEGFEKTLFSQKNYESPHLPPENEYPELSILGKLIADIRRSASVQLARRGPFWDYHALSFVMAYKHIQWTTSPRRKAVAYLSLRTIADSLLAAARFRERIPS
jgi:hypothetical protein